MSDLAAFYAARLDEAAAGAWAVHDIAKCDWLMYEEDLAAGAREGHCDCGYPDRIRREVEAGRKLLAAWQDNERERPPGDALSYTDGLADGLRLAVGYLAAVYPEWKP